MRLSWKIGRVSGIDLYLHASALGFLFLFYAWTGSLSLSIAYVAALLGSVVLHELGHALMARRYGIKTADISLYLIGGVARLERMPRSAGPELLITIAGPAVNFAIMLGLMLISTGAEWMQLPPLEFLDSIAYLNQWMGLFNLLPIFPMDGGRILRALLSGPLGRLRATEISAFLGRTIAVVGGIFFLSIGQFQTLILAVFVYMAGTMELRQVRREARDDDSASGLDDVPPPPAGFRWTERGDGVWRLVPIMAGAPGTERSWN